MNALVLPVIVPFIASALCLMMTRSLALQKVVSGIAGHATLGISCWLAWIVRDGSVPVLRLGGWPGGFGIVYALDRLGAIMLVLGALMFVTSWWFTVLGAVKEGDQRRFYHPLFLLLLAGVSWAFLTADLFNLFVAFELILLGSYALLTNSNSEGQVREGFKFAIMNVIAGMLFLAGAGLAYGTLGTLNLSDLALAVAATEQRGLATALAVLFIAVFGMKAAMFPLFFWMPDAYPKAPLGIQPFFVGILSKVGVYSLYRVLTLVFPGSAGGELQPLLLFLAGATMLVGVLSALSQWTFRHILAFHSMSQIGYMLMGLSLFTAAGLAGGVFFLVHHALVKSALFLVAGIVILREGTDRLKEARGLLVGYPVVAAMFLLGAFTLAGLPPTMGFYGKFALVLEGLATEHYVLTIASLVTSVFTLASMVKIWTYSFTGERPEGAPSPGRAPRVMWAGALVCALLVLAPVLSGPIMEYCAAAAEQSLDRSAYVTAVSGEQAWLWLSGEGATLLAAEARP